LVFCPAKIQEAVVGGQHGFMVKQGLIMPFLVPEARGLRIALRPPPKPG
jgi:hypothetical protein